MAVNPLSAADCAPGHRIALQWSLLRIWFVVMRTRAQASSLARQYGGPG
jgi:hypothetical protein